MKSRIFAVSAACVTALLGLVTRVAGASVQEPLNERRIASSSTASSRGEIDYSFDSALNRTRVLYRTSLEPGNLIKRLFNSPEVHTLMVAYEFGGRANPAIPDAVRLTLLSDQYYAGPLDNGRPTSHSPLLVIRIGETVLHYPVEIAQMKEVSSDPGTEHYQLVDGDNHNPRVNINPRPNQVHVHRRATARIPICEFLIFANSRDVHGTVAGLEFDMSDEVLGGLRRFAAEMEPVLSGASQPVCMKDQTK